MALAPPLPVTNQFQMWPELPLLPACPQQSKTIQNPAFPPARLSHALVIRNLWEMQVGEAEKPIPSFLLQTDFFFLLKGPESNLAPLIQFSECLISLPP